MTRCCSTCGRPLTPDAERYAQATAEIKRRLRRRRLAWRAVTVLAWAFVAAMWVWMIARTQW